MSDWRERAACYQQHAVKFGGIIDAPGDRHLEAECKRICRTCPVRRDCLTAGLDEPDGIWGGLSEKERAELRKRRARVA